jgi:hypothetical protein
MSGFMNNETTTTLVGRDGRSGDSTNPTERTNIMKSEKSKRASVVRQHIAEIAIPGDVLMPRELFARTILGVHDRSAKRMNLPTTFVGGVAYVAKGASLKIIADKVRRPYEVGTLEKPLVETA